MFTFPPWITIYHHSYLESKLSTRTIQFLPVRLLDTIGPVAMLFEHVCGFLPETSRPGENVILTYEQMKDLGAITSSAIRLLRNASASLSKERRKGVLNKGNSKGTLASPASEEFPQAGKSLFGEWIRSKDQDQIRDSKDLILSTASVEQNSRPAQSFFSEAAPPHSEDERTAGVVPVKGFQIPATSASFGIHSEAEAELAEEPCSKSLQPPSREAFSLNYHQV